MSIDFKHGSAPSPVMMEELEERRLLAVAWGPVGTLIGQDTAAIDFPTITGKGQTIAVIDSGVLINHPAFKNPAGFPIIGGWNFVNNTANLTDPIGHGSIISGILAANWYAFQGHWYRGLANGAKLLILKVDDGINTVPDSRIKRALDWIIAYKSRFNITAVNLSFGDGVFVRKTSMSAYGAELATLNRMNVFVGAASGNDGSVGGVDYPAADPNAVAVGSVGLTGGVSSFTNVGPDLDLLAPGENVPSTTFNAFTGANMIWPGSGTSFATPFIVAAAVLVRQINPALSNAQVLSILKRSGTPVTDPDSGLTFPLLNIDRALRLARLTKPPTKPAATPATASMPLFALSAITLPIASVKDLGVLASTASQSVLN